MPPSHRHVRRACGTEISDRQLTQLARLAHDARDGNITQGETEYLLANIGPLLDELTQRRQVDAHLAAIFQQANVIPLRGEVS